MNGSLNLRTLFAPSNIRTLAGPLLIILILSMMVLPLPAFVLDLMFTFNIAVSVMVMLVAMYAKRPLDFSVFPTVLLVTTLLRLSLNVASTRVVLLEGHTGPDAAGKVIEAFGHFLVGGNTAVGLVVFIILTLINFVVITKGAGRIAEVGARFTLDAMPGKQMAIDADLNAGLIDEKEAKRRRAETSQEADFYGAMDGASKFVRGDAVAGILIMAINVIGGLIVGVLQHNMELAQAANIYTLLTIGDGLVAQLPALIISVAAGLVVSRVGDDGDMGSQVIGQVFSNPQVLILTAAILGILGPHPRHAELRVPAAGRRSGLSGLAGRGAQRGRHSRRGARRGAGGAGRKPGGQLVRRHPGGCSRPRSGLPPDSDGGQGAGRRASQAHPRPAQKICQ
jgi:flagellar biosynthesis protein FlhA